MSPNHAVASSPHSSFYRPNAILVACMLAVSMSALLVEAADDTHIPADVPLRPSVEAAPQGGSSASGFSDGALLGQGVLNADPAKDTWKVLKLFLAVVFGMVGKCLYDEARRKGTRHHPWQQVRRIAKPLLVSPIVFLMFWELAPGIEFGLISALHAYLIGFFWKVAFDRMERSAKRQER